MLLDSAVGSGFRCGSASPVCYLISVLGAARRFPWWCRTVPDALFRAARRFLSWFWVTLDPLFRAARRLLFDTRSRYYVRLGVACGCIGCALDPVLRAARRV